MGIEISINEGILIFVSILSTAAFFNIALYFGYGKKLAYLFFAGYCLFHCFKIYLKKFSQDQVLISSLDWTSYHLIYISVLLAFFSLNVFLAYKFNISHKRIFIISLVLYSIIFFFFVAELLFIQLSLFASIIFTLYHVINQGKHHIILIGLLLFAGCIILGFREIIPLGYFVGVSGLIVCMMLSTSIEMSKQNRAFQEAKLRSSRLENQLLKTTIQPHFILNSLTSLQELIEFDAEKASKFVQDLSTEFELFAQISDRDFISIQDELELVKSYIDIMSIRKNVEFDLITHNINQQELIPPGVFLTLIENGISHGYENRQRGTFSISKKSVDRQTVYEVFNDGDTTPHNHRKGMGLSYVVSRLKESYGQNFTFHASPVANGWLAKITLIG